MIPPIDRPRSPSPIIDWLSEAEGWILMRDKLPPYPGIYETFDNTSLPRQRILRWSGQNWVIQGLTVAPNVMAWRELQDSLSDSDEEPCDICGEGAPYLLNQ